LADAPNESVKAVAALCGASLLWGASFIAMKAAMTAFSPMFIVFARLALGATLMLWLLRKQGGVIPPRRDMAPILFMTLCEPCLYFTFEAKALQYTQAAQAGMITAMLPLMVTAAAAFFLKERMGARSLFGLFLAVVGVVCISLAGKESAGAPNPLLGNFLEFLAMVSAMGYIITAKTLGERHSPLFLTAMQAIMGTIFFAPVLFFVPLPDSFPFMPSLAVVFLAVGVTFAAFVLYNYGVSKVEASRASVFINLIPVFTLVMAWLFLDERLTPGQYLGVAVVFCGVFLSARATPKPNQSLRGE